MSTETISLIRDGEKVEGGGALRWGEGYDIYYCYTLSPPEWLLH